MSYQVLARKWRPHTFSEMVGQEHVVRALSNALDNDRLHHAYLFTGTRGVGKTTLARIFAKSLNCETGVTSSPCGTCASCIEIDEGRFVDMLEVDAASRTKVDQTRELLDNVPYAPVRGRYKVYLIDEVHMFSSSSFNALLKTLEEPPPHVKFLLATTDPQKVPVTVLSRCLQFNLKRLLVDQIHGQLQRILDQEKLPYDDQGLLSLARAADGSMRDGLSLMDQAIAFGGGRVEDADVRAMLGNLDQSQITEIIIALAEQDGAKLLDRIAQMAEHAPDYAAALQDLLSALHQIALLQVSPEISNNRFDVDSQAKALAEKISPEDIQLFYQIGLIGQRDLPYAPDPRSGFEMVLLRMLAFIPSAAGPGETKQTQVAPRQPKSAPTKKTAPTRTAPHQAASSPQPVPSRVEPAVATNSAVSESPVAPVVKATEQVASPTDVGQWHEMVAALKLGGMSRQLANNCLFDRMDGATVHLILDPSCSHILNPRVEQRLLQALQERLGADSQLNIRVGDIQGETPAQRDSRAKAECQREAEQSMVSDELVNSLEDNFSARLVLDSIKPE